jgi:uncharacterized protein involved in exopolysaccharide biosynthesis
LRTAQFSIDELMAIFRRRRKLLYYPVLIVTALCILGAFLLPRKYTASTTIFVQQKGILNPLINYTMAVTMANEDKLRTFEQIIYSRMVIQALIDTLKLGVNVTTEGERQALIKAVQRNIETDRKGSESFSLTYVDTDPERAQRAAQSLATLFIEANLQVENQQNDLAVHFFENKLEELRVKFEASQKELVSTMSERLGDMPAEAKTMYDQLQTFEKRITDIDSRLNSYQSAMTTLRSFPEALQDDEGKQTLYDLLRNDLPFGTDLRTLLTKYDDLSKRYTPKYPEVVKMETQLTELLQRMRSAVESEMVKQQNERWEVERRRTETVDRIKQMNISARTDQDKESNYGIYRNLYDEMKVKLEQARTNRDLGSNSANQFIIIDPPVVPTEPSKPNRPMIIGGGFGAGVILGLLAIILAEIFDTRLRTFRDVEVYHKPVVAYIPDGTGGHS